MDSIRNGKFDKVRLPDVRRAVNSDKVRPPDVRRAVNSDKVRMPDGG